MKHMDRIDHPKKFLGKCKLCNMLLPSSKQMVMHITGVKDVRGAESSTKADHRVPCEASEITQDEKDAIMTKWLAAGYEPFWTSMSKGDIRGHLSHEHVPSDAAAAAADRSWALAIIESGSFLTTEHESFDETFKHVGVRYHPPKRKVVRRLLDEIYGDIEALVENVLAKFAYVQLSADGWTDLRGKSVTGMMALSGTDAVLIGATENRQLEKQGSEFVANEFEVGIERVGGSARVNGIITDNENKMQAAWTTAMAVTMTPAWTRATATAPSESGGWWMVDGAWWVVGSTNGQQRAGGRGGVGGY